MKILDWIIRRLSGPPAYDVFKNPDGTVIAFPNDMDRARKRQAVAQDSEKARRKATRPAPNDAA